jgi:hypothetical protein
VLLCLLLSQIKLLLLGLPQLEQQHRQQLDSQLSKVRAQRARNDQMADALSCMQAAFDKLVKFQLQSCAEAQAEGAPGASSAAAAVHALAGIVSSQANAFQEFMLPGLKTAKEQQEQDQLTPVAALPEALSDNAPTLRARLLAAEQRAQAAEQHAPQAAAQQAAEQHAPQAAAQQAAEQHAPQAAAQQTAEQRARAAEKRARAAEKRARDAEQRAVAAEQGTRDAEMRAMEQLLRAQALKDALLKQQAAQKDTALPAAAPQQPQQPQQQPQQAQQSQPGSGSVRPLAGAHAGSHSSGSRSGSGSGSRRSMQPDGSRRPAAPVISLL